MPGATPTYGLPYPIGTDRLDAAVTTIPQSLATAVESTLTSFGGIAAPAAWQTPTLHASWANLGSGFAPIRYRKAGSRVYLRGTGSTAAGTGAGVTLLTLPVGFRPTAGSFMFVCLASGATGRARVDITTAGAVVISDAIGASGFLSLDNIAFYID